MYVNLVRGRGRTHPCSQTAVVLVVTVPLLEARARAVVFLLHEPVVDSLSRQTGIDYKTVAWKQIIKYYYYLLLLLAAINYISFQTTLMFSIGGPSSKS